MQHRPTGESSHAYDLRCARYAYLHISTSAGSCNRTRSPARARAHCIWTGSLTAVASGGDNVSSGDRGWWCPLSVARRSCRTIIEGVVGGCIISVCAARRVSIWILEKPGQELQGQSLKRIFSSFSSGLKTLLIFHEREIPLQKFPRIHEFFIIFFKFLNRRGNFLMHRSPKALITQKV